MFHSQRDALMQIHRQPRRRRSASDQTSPPSSSSSSSSSPVAVAAPGASSINSVPTLQTVTCSSGEDTLGVKRTDSQRLRHSVDGPETVKRIVLQKRYRSNDGSSSEEHSPPPSSAPRTLAEKIARSEVDCIGGFWAKRLAAPKPRRTISVPPRNESSLSSSPPSSLPLPQSQHQPPHLQPPRPDSPSHLPPTRTPTPPVILGPTTIDLEPVHKTPITARSYTHRKSLKKSESPPPTPSSSSTTFSTKYTSAEKGKARSPDEGPGLSGILNSSSSNNAITNNNGNRQIRPLPTPPSLSLSSSGAGVVRGPRDPSKRLSRPLPVPATVPIQTLMSVPAPVHAPTSVTSPTSPAAAAMVTSPIVAPKPVPALSKSEPQLKPALKNSARILDALTPVSSPPTPAPPRPLQQRELKPETQPHKKRLLPPRLTISLDRASQSGVPTSTVTAAAAMVMAGTGVSKRNANADLEVNVVGNNNNNNLPQFSLSLPPVYPLPPMSMSLSPAFNALSTPPASQQGPTPPLKLPGTLPAILASGQPLAFLSKPPPSPLLSSSLAKSKVNRRRSQSSTRSRRRRSKQYPAAAAAAAGVGRDTNKFDGDGEMQQLHRGRTSGSGKRSSRASSRASRRSVLSNHDLNRIRSTRSRSRSRHRNGVELEKMMFADPEEHWVISEKGAAPVPRIYYTLAKQKKLVRQMSEQRKRKRMGKEEGKRRTGLARIVVEVAAGQVTKRLEWDSLDEEGGARHKEMRVVVEQLRKMKAM